MGEVRMITVAAPLPAPSPPACYRWTIDARDIPDAVPFQTRHPIILAGVLTTDATWYSMAYATAQKDGEPPILVEDVARIRLDAERVARIWLDCGQPMIESAALPEPPEEDHARRRIMETMVAMASYAISDAGLVVLDNRVPGTLLHWQIPDGHADHGAWRAAWRESRCDQFVVKDSHEEISGNKTCKAVVQDDAALDPQGRGRPSLTLHLLVPEGLRAVGIDGKPVTHLMLPGIRFGHGHDDVVAAIQAANAYRTTTEARARDQADGHSRVAGRNRIVRRRDRSRHAPPPP